MVVSSPLCGIGTHLLAFTIRLRSVRVQPSFDTNYILTSITAWYSGFYSAASSFNLGAALSNTNGNDYKLIIRDIDAIATQLKRLQSAGVPILWRPLHEAEGGWVRHTRPY